MIDKGALYVAYGDRAIEQAAISIATLRARAPDLCIAVVSDRDKLDADILIEKPDADSGAREWKTQMYQLSPFNQTLFLDADTEVLSSPKPGFTLLQYADIVLGQDLNRVFGKSVLSRILEDEFRTTIEEIGGPHHMYFNSGVIFFNRNDRIEAMMTAWHEEWCRWRAQDQPALLRAIHRCPVRVAPIRFSWNSNNRAGAAFVYHKYRSARRSGAPG